MPMYFTANAKTHGFFLPTLLRNQSLLNNVITVEIDTPWNEDRERYSNVDRAVSTSEIRITRNSRPLTNNARSNRTVAY